MTTSAEPQMDAEANAELEPWKAQVLQEPITAVQAAPEVVEGYPEALRPVAVAQFLLESAWGQSSMGSANN